jgi:S1-C subfamily serine protease
VDERLETHSVINPLCTSGQSFFGPPSVVTVEASDGHGSGCIISSDGYIVTNYHVIADGLDTYPVHFHDGSVIEAQVVRYHPVYDLALLKVNAPIYFLFT